jgi:hypothetical protein
MRPNAIRFRVDPGDVPPEKAARRLGLTLDAFTQVREELIARGFPRPDPTTGNYDLVAIDAWIDGRSTKSLRSRKCRRLKYQSQYEGRKRYPVPTFSPVMLVGMMAAHEQAEIGT